LLIAARLFCLAVLAAISTGFGGRINHFVVEAHFRPNLCFCQVLIFVSAIGGQPLHSLGFTPFVVGVEPPPVNCGG